MYFSFSCSIRHKSNISFPVNQKNSQRFVVWEDLYNIYILICRKMTHGIKITLRCQALFDTIETNNNYQKDRRWYDDGTGNHGTTFTSLVGFITFTHASVSGPDRQENHQASICLAQGQRHFPYSGGINPCLDSYGIEILGIYVKIVISK